MRNLGPVRNLGRGPSSPPHDRAAFTSGYMAALDDATEYLTALSGQGDNHVIIADFMQHATDQRFILSGMSDDASYGQRIGYTELLDKLYKVLDGVVTPTNGMQAKVARILDMLLLLDGMRAWRAKKYGAVA